MNITFATRKILEIMPDIAFGEDKSDFIAKVVRWAREESIHPSDAIEYARIKWQSYGMQDLLNRIKAGDQDALKEAVITLIEDNYIIHV